MNPAGWLEFAEKIAGVKSPEGLTSAFRDALRLLGFDDFNYGAGATAGSTVPQTRRIWSTMSAEWISRYAERRYYREDRLVAQALVRATPFGIAEVFARPPTSAAQREMENTFDYPSGLVVPLHGPAGFGIVSAASRLRPVEFARLQAEAAPALTLMSAFLHERAEALDALSSESTPPSLTERERECLLWAASGKRTAEIAEILALSERTVKKHVSTAMTKLGVATRTQAVAKAIAGGLIRP